MSEAKGVSSHKQLNLSQDLRSSEVPYRFLYIAVGRRLCNSPEGAARRTPETLKILLARAGESLAIGAVIGSLSQSSVADVHGCANTDFHTCTIFTL